MTTANTAQPNPQSAELLDDADYRPEIVIIDDNPVNLLLLKKMVLGLGAGDPVCFEDPAEALEHCLAHPPAVVVTDYMMPGLDGLQLVERMMQVPDLRNTLVLMVTAVEDKELMKDALKSGVTDFLTKPVDGVEFRLRLRTLLRLAESLSKQWNLTARLSIEHAQTLTRMKAQETELVNCLARVATFRAGREENRSLRVAAYVARISQEMGLSSDECLRLRDAATLYDIGQLGVPDTILDKTDKLTTAEFTTVQSHPRIGFDILNASTSPLLQEAARMARSHHEAFDGSGYPDKLQGEDIPLSARIVAVADVFDALMSDRPHRAAWSFEKAVTFIRDAKAKQFDPAVVAAFERSIIDLLAIKNEFEKKVSSMKSN